MKKINLESFLEPPHHTHQPNRPAPLEFEPGAAPIYDESDIQPQVYGPGVHDMDGYLITGQQVSYERIEDE
jgi:hypothetical protein